jgi:hypothetical protein
VADCRDGDEAAESGDFGFEEHPMRARKTIPTEVNARTLKAKPKYLTNKLPPSMAVG